MAGIDFTQDRVKELFTYKDGGLYWNKPRHHKSRVKAGERAGSVHEHKKGARRYIIFKTGGRKCRFAEARLIFLYHHGYLPQLIDHINRDPLDNRIENLREATIHQNNINVSLQKNNTTGYKGVSIDKRKKSKPYRAILAHKQLGMYATPEEAAKAYDRAAVEKYGEFAVVNFA